ELLPEVAQAAAELLAAVDHLLDSVQSRHLGLSEVLADSSILPSQAFLGNEGDCLLERLGPCTVFRHGAPFELLGNERQHLLQGQEVGLGRFLPLPSSAQQLGWCARRPSGGG